MTTCYVVKVRILGIDPGSRKTGWGLIEVSGQSMHHIDNGVLFLDDDRDLTIRLRDLAHRLRDVLTEHKPDCMALEDVFVHKSPRSALLLGQARGVAIGCAGLHDLPVHSFAPSLVKQAVTGTGRAEKSQVAHMVCQLLRLPEVPFEDAADAVAVAICCALHGMRPSTAAVPRTRAARSTKSSARKSLASLARAQGKL
jgi:crossover junction endodeoxyribonuclease RuvC